MDQKLNNRLESIAQHVRNQTSKHKGSINTLNNKRVSGLYKLVCDEKLLIDSYLRIRSKQSANTSIKGAMLHQYGKEINPETNLDGISNEKIQKIANTLRDESFQFKPATQILIPKPGKKTKRPLGLPEPTDKIVQRAMATVLATVFEEGQIFSDFSHAYRPNRGAHSCLQMVEKSFQSSRFVIEADLKGYFPSIVHEKLIKILEKYIDDKRFINLVWKALKAGIVTLIDTEKPRGDWIFMPSGRTGTPQGSIVSPILSNIYLHELDHWMHDICKKREKRPRNKRVQALIGQNTKDRKTIKNNPNKKKELAKVIRKRKILIRTLSSTENPKNPTYRYVRYCDDFILGCEGSFTQTCKIKEDLSYFLKNTLGVTLDLEKSLTTNLNTSRVEFLGYHIYKVNNHTYHRYIVKSKEGYRLTKRRGNNKLRFQMNRAKVIDGLKTKGIIKNLGHQKYRAISVGNKVSLSDREIVSYFESIRRGLLNYYSGAFNRADLAQMQHLIKRSCAMTLAHKHRTSSRKIFKKHGQDLKIKWKTKNNKPKINKLNLMETFKTSDRE